MAMVASALRLLLLGALVSATGGCVSSEVVKRSERLNDGPHPALLATYQVEVGRTSRGDVFALTGGQLAKFGLAALPRLEAAFRDIGLELQLDLARSNILDEKALLRPSNKLSTLTGVWTHPQGSSYRFDYPTRGSDDSVAEALAAADRERPYFASITVFIDEQKSFPAKSAPLVRVSTRVLDREGKPVLFARTEGAGRAIALVADRSLDNLLAGLDVALEQLRTMPRELY